MLLPGKAKVAVGRILKTHGIKGELNLELSDAAEPDEDFAPGSALIFELEGLDVPFFVESTRPRGADSILLTLDGIASERDAAPLVGQTAYVYVDPEELDEPSAGDLVGFRLTDAASGRDLGEITELHELTPGAWYFTLADGRLIPVVDEFIVDVDPAARRVAMTLPEGLLEL